MVGLFIIKGTAMPNYTPSTAKSLAEIKDQLYKLFNKAADTHNGSYSEEVQDKAVERMQTLTKSIESVEREITTLDLLKALREEGGSIAFETGADGSTKISVLNPIRLKGSANAP